MSACDRDPPSDIAVLGQLMLRTVSHKNTQLVSTNAVPVSDVNAMSHQLWPHARDNLS